MITIVYGHPYAGSFNHAILDAVREALTARNARHVVIDLYADGFDPAVRAGALALYGAGRTNDALAEQYLGILRDTTQIIFVYPVWWGTEPAIIKGFYDSVLLKDATWTYSPDGRLLPRLTIEKTTIFTTSEAPGAFFASYFEHYLPEHVFDAVGMRNVAWHNLENITTVSAAEREAFLTLVRASV